ncbi:MAG: DEAD/DEAH box helicase [Nanoarchaeota archaeon]|nr:DEAD/DEAH box helicase [Nanoarchaeota archaeon]
MEFKGLTLDKFQEDAIAAVDRGHSVVVSASTGTGKTLIAEYIISKHTPEDVVIYTAPIKALSNQKFRDFCEDYGKEHVGLLTGDHSINNQAPLLVMTTEIYRNMLLTNDPLVDKIKYVIFDEVHYINDIQRGTVWEESIIFSPEHIRFLALSATIPNYREFAAWIQDIKHHEVETVFYGHRPVPLRHEVYDTKLGLTTIEKIQADMLQDEAAFEMLEMHKKKKSHHKTKKKSHLHNLKQPHHLDVVKLVKTPALYFCFSRQKTQDFAVELARKKDFSSTQEAQEITEYVRSQMTPEISSMENTRMLRSVLPKGIGFHHSGMLPQLKHIVEHLFGKGLIKILYTTETFSVGINMPAKTVIFNGLDKYDGVSLRMLNAKEYFQIAGRAGRRGLDKEGQVIAMIHRRFANLEKLRKISTIDDEPIISQFTLSMNTVLNLIGNYDDSTQEKILKSSFDYYTRTKQNKKVHIMASYTNRIKTLKKLKYVIDSESLDQTGGAYVEHEGVHTLTDKGRFASKLYANEITLTELFHLPFLEKISDLDLLTVLAAIVYEPRRLDYFMIKGSEKTYHRILKRLDNTRLSADINRINLKRMINFVKAWATGAKFTVLMSYCNLAEGDIIRFFRRLIDTLNQLQHATEDKMLRERLEKLSELIDRDLVSADL